MRRSITLLNTELRNLSNASLQNIRFIIRLSAHLFPRSSRGSSLIIDDVVLDEAGHRHRAGGKSGKWVRTAGSRKLHRLRSTELVWQRWNKRLRNMLYLSQHLKHCALFRSLQSKKIYLDEELTAAEGDWRSISL